MGKERFCALVIQEQDRMFWTARSILKSDQDAEDAVQEAICAAFVSREQLREEERFRPWVMRILTNKCYDLCRKRQPQVELGEVEGCLSAPERDVEGAMSLHAALARLEEEQRLPVLLFYFEGFSVREIAECLELTEGAVKTRLSRARAKLKELLKEM